MLLREILRPKVRFELLALARWALLHTEGSSIFNCRTPPWKRLFASCVFKHQLVLQVKGLYSIKRRWTSLFYWMWSAFFQCILDVHFSKLLILPRAIHRRLIQILASMYDAFCLIYGVSFADLSDCIRVYFILQGSESPLRADSLSSPFDADDLSLSVMLSYASKSLQKSLRCLCWVRRRLLLTFNSGSITRDVIVSL